MSAEGAAAKPGIFIPYRHAKSVRPVAGGYPALGQAFADRRAAFDGTLDAIDRHGAALKAIPAEATAPAARWNQDWFPRLDAACAYALVRERRPNLIAEIGSGHSTRFLARAVQDSGGATRIVAVDPEPRAPIALPGVEHIRATLQDAGDAPFDALASGDMLFVDSSHVLMPGSDVDIVLNRLLPALPAGVLVHLHDVFLPEAYPQEWTWRGYNEQNAIAAMLQGGAWQPLFASRYARKAHAERLARSVVSALPLWPGAYESSLWLEKA